MSLAVSLLIAFAIGYALGAIPFGLLLTRAAGLGDVRNIGSGNIGATNVLRTGRKGLALATLLLDGLKGAAAVLLARQLWGPDAGIVAGLGAFLGHVFPVWLDFKGGKGVATYIGVLLAMSWPAGLLFCGVWIAVAVLTRYSSLAALTSAVLIPIAMSVDGWGLPAIEGYGGPALSIVMTLLLFWTHRGNITRLMSGKESKIGAKS